LTKVNRSKDVKIEPQGSNDAVIQNELKTSRGEVKELGSLQKKRKEKLVDHRGEEMCRGEKNGTRRKKGSGGSVGDLHFSGLSGPAWEKRGGKKRGGGKIWVKVTERGSGVSGFRCKRRRGEGGKLVGSTDLKTREYTKKRRA